MNLHIDSEFGQLFIVHSSVKIVTENFQPRTKEKKNETNVEITVHLLHCCISFKQFRQVLFIVYIVSGHWLESFDSASQSKTFANKCLRIEINIHQEDDQEFPMFI